MLIAKLITDLSIIYLAAGAIFAAVFVVAGVSRIDPAAKGAPLGFRLLIFPGVAALWPFLLMKWLRSRS